jgi:hypothetical protein
MGRTVEQAPTHGSELPRFGSSGFLLGYVTPCGAVGRPCHRLRDEDVGDLGSSLPSLPELGEQQPQGGVSRPRPGGAMTLSREGRKASEWMPLTEFLLVSVFISVSSNHPYSNDNPYPQTT